jgi:hypothetical protein
MPTFRRGEMLGGVIGGEVLLCSHRRGPSSVCLRGSKTMPNGVSPDLCQLHGCQEFASTIVVTYPGSIEHRACDAHRQPARAIAEHEQAVAYRVVSDQPILIPS